MTISLNSKKIQEVYAEYSNEDLEGIPKFDKTHKIVELIKLGMSLMYLAHRHNGSFWGWNILTISI